MEKVFLGHVVQVCPLLLGMEPPGGGVAPATQGQPVWVRVAGLPSRAMPPTGTEGKAVAVGAAVAVAVMVRAFLLFKFALTAPPSALMLCQEPEWSV